MVNRVILIGNLGKDPEIRRLENGASVGKFSVATNENYKDKSGEWQTQTEWHDIVVWRSLADRAEANLKKGMSVYIEGKLTHRTWQDQDGNNRYTTEVVASYFRILSKKEGGQNMGANNSPGYFPGAENEASAQVNTQPTTTPTTSMPEPEAGDSNTADDDLPF